jgi:acetate kinase
VNVLVLNAGSSSLKFSLLRLEGKQEELRAKGLVEKWGTPEASLRINVSGQEVEHRSVAAENPDQAAEHAIRACQEFGIDALGHRVVHGGARFREPARIDPQVITAIREVSHLAPLHNDLALAGIEAGTRALPDTPTVAVFDTAFHQTIPEVAALYALPVELSQQYALRRYGFHGISHRFVSSELLELIHQPINGSKLITAHLGNGASVCAIRDGKSVDTSMGLTPMEGLVMGTRTGDVDPGLLLHLMREANMDAGQLDELLNRKSGLLGLSGRGSDMRDIEQSARDGDARSTLSLEIFAYRIRKYVGAYSVILGGVHAIAFAGGIGEHSADTRRRVCDGLRLLGMHIDPAKNAAAPSDQPTRINADLSGVEIWVIPTDEERQIAREVRQILS